MSPIGFAHPDDTAHVRALLEEVGYRDDGVRELLGAAHIAAPAARDVPGLLRKTAGGSPLETLVRLLLIGAPVEVEAARAAVSPTDLDAWAEAGLVSIDGGAVRGLVTLAPLDEFLLACDEPSQVRDGAREDFVMGIGASTRSLADLTIRRPVRSMLDMGCGCGTHAFLASRHAERVVAVDFNERAVEFTRLNAALSGLDNVEALQGDLFAPVAGQRFDLVVSNPPFVISPSSRYIYRDGGMEGDAFCQRLVREVPEYLEDGGYCQILCNWAVHDGASWQDRLRSWFADTGCDAWVLCHETGDASTYARTWIGHTEEPSPELFARRYDEWMAYYAEAGIVAVCAGSIAMRKRTSGEPTYHAGNAPRLIGACGEDIAMTFEARDYLAASSENDLLETRFRLSPVARLEQTCEQKNRTWHPVQTLICRTAGLGFAGRVNDVLARLTAMADGRRTLREIVTKIAREDRVTFDRLWPPVRAGIVGLIEQVFLVPRT